ncbi:MAG TPA: bacillithiol biosynthesis cysteine-adding enzyme BshC, partial [Bacillaceae bacterium]
MVLESIAVPATNRFASLYIDQQDPVKDFFHYPITDEVFALRHTDLMERDFNREGLAQCIRNYMKRFPVSDKTNFSLEKLASPKSAVVIGGQQAGLLTGPLYTIHKIISIIKLAEEQEREMGVPVVPVFWIAGEDHDFLEINHVYTENQKKLRKISYPELPYEKVMASDFRYDKEKMHKWIDLVVEHLGEREHTKETMHFLHAAAEKGETVTDMFSYIIMALFKEYGLLVIDSADRQLRKLEVPLFQELIDKAEILTETVLNQQELIVKHGFGRAIELDQHASNLFYYDGNERLLLEWDPAHNRFMTKNGEHSFSKAELQDILTHHPERFSNNVVTRPLMQEW